MLTLNELEARFVAMKKIFKSVEFYCVVMMLLCFGLLCYGQVRIDNVVLHRGDEHSPIELPLSERIEVDESFSVGFRVLNPLSVPYDLNIVPDDCAEMVVVNGTNVSLENYSGKCDFSKGFWMDDSVMSPHRVGAETYYEVHLINKGGIGGINVFPKGHGILLFLLKFLLALSIGLLVACIARRFRLNVFLCVCVVVGTLLRFAIFDAFPYTKFSMDVEGHLAYVQHIADNHSIPADDECWSCYHPPVYYVSAVAPFLLSRWMGYLSSSGMQAYSLLLSILVLLWGMFLLQGIVSVAPLQIAAILWTVWPTLLLVAPRIGNDQLFYALHVLCLLSGANYVKCGKGKFLVVSVVAAGLAAWTKSTGLVSVGLAVLFALLGFVKPHQWHVPAKSEVASWIMLLLVLSGIVLEKVLGDGDLVANAHSLNSGLKVKSEARNFLYFDMKTFLTEPYTNGWSDQFGREYFFNFAFKSALFGEFELLKNALGKTLASLMSLSFLGLLVIAICGWWKNRLTGVHWILLAQGVAFFVALAYLRYRYPYACSNDFRYILPVLLSFVPYVGLGVFTEDASVKWKVLGCVTVAVFAVCSVLLMLNV